MMVPDLIVQNGEAWRTAAPVYAFDLEIPSYNPNGSHGHWSTCAAARRRAREAAFWVAKATLGPGRVETLPRAAVQLLCVWPWKRHFRDPDNLIASSKPVIDGLQDVGLFGNDRTLIWFPPVQKAIKGSTHTARYVISAVEGPVNVSAETIGRFIDSWDLETSSV